MFKNLSEEDFAVLRGPLESGRQRPQGMAGVLIICIPLQALLLFLEHFVGGYSIYPFKEEVFTVHLWGSVIVAVLSIIYSIPRVYMRSQKFQYFLGIIASQNLFGLSFYILGLAAIGASISTNADALVTFTYLTLAFGLIIFLASFTRYYIKLKKGEYRKGSKSDKWRSKAEKGIPSYLPIVIGLGVPAVLIMQFIIRNFELHGDALFILVLSTVSIMLFYVMLYILVEQLLILYCKFRFDSFNFEQTGRIKPMRDEEGNIIA